MLAESELTLDFQSFLRYFPQYVAQLERDFEALSGSYHIINFLANRRRSLVAWSSFPQQHYPGLSP
jgi:hypothetical protein